MSRLEEAQARCEAVPTGRWQWFGNTQIQDVYLATVDRGRLYLLGFQRWGFHNARPLFYNSGKPGMTDKIEEFARYEQDYRKDFQGLDNPVAEFIAHSGSDLPDALAVVAAIAGWSAISGQCLLCTHNLNEQPHDPRCPMAKWEQPE